MKSEQAILDEIETFEQAMKIFYNPSCGNKLENGVLKKMMELVVTFEQARIVYDNSPYGSKTGKKAKERMVELAGKMDTFEQARARFNAQ